MKVFFVVKSGFGMTQSLSDPGERIISLDVLGGMQPVSLQTYSKMYGSASDPDSFRFLYDTLSTSYNRDHVPLEAYVLIINKLM